MESITECLTTIRAAFRGDVSVCDKCQCFASIRVRSRRALDRLLSEIENAVPASIETLTPEHPRRIRSIINLEFSILCALRDGLQFFCRTVSILLNRIVEMMESNLHRNQGTKRKQSPLD